MANYFIQLIRPDYKFRLFKKGEATWLIAVARPVPGDNKREILGIGR